MGLKFDAKMSTTTNNHLFAVEKKVSKLAHDRPTINVVIDLEKLILPCDSFAILPGVMKHHPSRQPHRNLRTCRLQSDQDI